MARPDFRAAATVRWALRGTGGGDSTACRCSFKSRVRQADTSLKGELDLRRIPDGNCHGNSGARIGVQARVTHDSPRGHKSEEDFFRCVTRRPATGLRPVRTNSLPKSGFLKQLCRTGVLPEVPLERPCSPGIRPNAGSRAAWTFSSRHPVPNYYPRNRCSRRTQQSGASASGSASQAINHPNPDQSAHKHRSRFGDRS